MFPLDQYESRVRFFLENNPESEESDFITLLIERGENLMMQSEKRSFDIQNSYKQIELREIIDEYKFKLKRLPKPTPVKEQEDEETTPPCIIEYSLTQTELLELVKALIQAGKVKGKQKEIITAFSKFFSVKVKNPDQTIHGFKTRNNDRETLFLDNLKTALLDYIKR